MAILQIIFIVSIIVIVLKHQMLIFENMQEITLSLEEINYEEMQGEEMNKDLLKDTMKKMVQISQSYREMIRNLLNLAWWSLGSFLFFNGLIWSLAQYAIKKGKWWKYWLKFISVTLAFLIPFSLVSYFSLWKIIASRADIPTFQLALKGFGLVLLVAVYFMVIGFSLSNEKFKELFRKMFFLGVKKIHWILASMVLVLLMIALSLIGIYFSMPNFPLMVLSTLALIIVLVGGRLFLISVVKELNKSLAKSRVQ
jgi:hypothetical protein